MFKKFEIIKSFEFVSVQFVSVSLIYTFRKMPEHQRRHKRPDTSPDDPSSLFSLKNKERKRGKKLVAWVNVQIIKINTDRASRYVYTHIYEYKFKKKESWCNNISLQVIDISVAQRRRISMPKTFSRRTNNQFCFSYCNLSSTNTS